MGGRPRMGFTLRPPIASVDRHVNAPPAAVWRLLVDVREWPRWGPSVRDAVLEGGGSELGPGTRGTVRTSLGVRLPFTVTEFDPDHRWTWAVAGVTATGHSVRAEDGGCRVAFEVPWWATAYLPVCAAALVRIEKLAASR